MSEINWEAIRQAYERGVPLRTIVAEHGSSIATISRVARQENWTPPVRTLETRNMKHETGKPTPVSLPLDAHSIARAGLRQLAQHLQTDDLLTIGSHKSLSDALAQYVKVLSTTLQEEQEPQDGLVIPLDRLSAHARMEIRRILVEDEQGRKEHIG